MSGEVVVDGETTLRVERLRPRRLYHSYCEAQLIPLAKAQMHYRVYFDSL